MSVWKKASKSNQKTHRERHQPEERKHLGLLEKKKDYVKRARDYNDKQDTLKLLRKRALNRNPEEFYHHMINSKVTGSVHHEKDKSEEHTKEQVKLMETQDIKYINMKRTLEMKKIERLQSQLHLIDVEKPKNSHKYFFENKQEAKEFKKTKKKSEIKYSIEKLREKPLVSNLDGIAEIVSKRKETYRELSGRIEREEQLSIIQQKLEIKRHLQTKKKCLPPKKVKGSTEGTPAVYKWKFQRQH